MSGSWTKQQQEALEKFVENGIFNWTEMSQLMRKKFPKKPRTPKQCRERYCDFILFKGKILRKGEWGQQEAERFYSLILNYGLSWTKIAGSLLEGNNKSLGSSNSLKNKYYANLKTYMKKLYPFLKKKDPQMSIKWTCFKRFVCLNFYGLSQQLKRPDNYDLAKQIIEHSILKNKHPTEQEAIRIHSQVQKFNQSNKSLNTKKSVKFHSYKIASVNKFAEEPIPIKMQQEELPEVKVEEIPFEMKDDLELQVKLEEQSEQRILENIQFSTLSQNGRKSSSILKETPAMQSHNFKKKMETQEEQEIFVQKPRKKKKIFFTLNIEPSPHHQFS